MKRWAWASTVTSSIRRRGPARAMVYYRDYSGSRSADASATAGRRQKRAARCSKLCQRALGVTAMATSRPERLSATRPKGWLAMFEGQVERGQRSPSTLDAVPDAVERHIDPGVGSLRLGEVTTPRLDRFVQARARRSVATRPPSSAGRCSRAFAVGSCGVTALTSNPVRDLTPLELDRDRTARALSVEEDPRMACASSTPIPSRSVTTCPSWRGSCWRPACGWGGAWGTLERRRHWIVGVGECRAHDDPGEGQGLDRRAGQVEGVLSGARAAGVVLRDAQARRVRLGAFDGRCSPTAKGG